jgi:poly-gamma-glutamate synthesis protein (capsule biosynthesis protein)
MGHRILEECGVDVIIGNHPHVIQPIEKYDYIDIISKKKKTGLIAYSLGNLVADFNTKNSLLSCLLKFKFLKGTQNGQEKTIISDLKIKPIYTFKEYHDGKYEQIRLLDFLKLTSELDDGNNKYNLDNENIEEIYRLKKLLFKILPDKYEKLL